MAIDAAACPLHASASIASTTTHAPANNHHDAVRTKRIAVGVASSHVPLLLMCRCCQWRCADWQGFTDGGRQLLGRANTESGMAL